MTGWSSSLISAFLIFANQPTENQWESENACEKNNKRREHEVLNLNLIIFYWQSAIGLALFASVVRIFFQVQFSLERIPKRVQTKFIAITKKRAREKGVNQRDRESRYRHVSSPLFSIISLRYQKAFICFAERDRGKKADCYEKRYFFLGLGTAFILTNHSVFKEHGVHFNSWSRYHL